MASDLYPVSSAKMSWFLSKILGTRSELALAGASPWGRGNAKQGARGLVAAPHQTVRLRVGLAGSWGETGP